MGLMNVGKGDAEALRRFMKRLLDDVHALETMLFEKVVESGKRRIGCEQEMFLIDAAWKASPIAAEVLDLLGTPCFTTELGRFNLELNLDPISFRDDCLSRMETELRSRLAEVRRATQTLNSDIVLTGVLPTLRKSDLDLSNMSPRPRYFALNEALQALRGGDSEFHLDGIDELEVRQDSLMLEACCTSFQAHYQADPENFATLYNAAQAVTAPLLAASVNSPMLFGRRLWSETRIPLFQQAVDTRHSTGSLRERAPRVSFGKGWVRDSVMELFQEDISRFPVLLSSTNEEDSLEMLRRGEIPKLGALQAYNSTVYRWNRACFGVTEGKPHLRIENRVLPAGPTILDEVANAAFFFGCLRHIPEAYGDMAAIMDFDDARTNFMLAAQEGLQAGFRWVQGKTINARSLILEELLPLAQKGLEEAGIAHSDIARYLGTFETRVASGQTGARWISSSVSAMRSVRRDSALAAVTAGMARRQWESEAPVHEWSLATPEEGKTMKRDKLRIEESMTTDLFTTHPEETIELVTHLMEWRHIRHVPVEDAEGRLVGLISSFEVLRYLNQRDPQNDGPVSVRALMNPSPLVAPPETSVQDAVAIMTKNKADCLLVVKDNHLVGIVTEHDILNLISDLLE